MSRVETDRAALADDEATVAIGAAACIDIWVGGDTSWRTEGEDGPSQEFMAGADWIMAEMLTRAVLRAVLPEGTRVIRPGHTALPTNADEAKAMWFVGERWIRDHAPELLRAPAGGGSAGAEAEGRALRMTLLFTHEAACNGILLRNSPDGTPDMVAEDICVAAAADLGCELGDAAWEGMLAQARKEVAAVALPTDTTPPGSPDADGAEGSLA